MISVSLCMIVKDEEATLKRCLESAIDLVDEVIIVDTGSTDKTKSIAAEFTDHIYDFVWIDDFSAARNYSFSKASKDYILWLDADDVILKEDAEKFLALKKTLKYDVDVVFMKYNLVDNAGEKVTLSYYRERLCKRHGNFKWVDPIHEYLVIKGNTMSTDICITHKKIHSTSQERNLRIFEKMISENKKLSPRNLFYYGRELYYNSRYEEAIALFEDFLDANAGWVEDKISACIDLSKCYNSIGKPKERLRALIRSFEYDTPRGEACCEIGYCYKKKGDFNRAIFWFELATRLDKPKGSLGFVYQDYWDYIPFIELCVCHEKLGHIDEAMRFNTLAAEIKPNDPAVLLNKRYFEGLIRD